MKPVVSDPIYDRSKLIELISTKFYFLLQQEQPVQPRAQIIFAKLSTKLTEAKACSLSGKIFTDLKIFSPLEAKCDLTICRLTETSGPVAGGKEILLFCDKINKDDVQVRFFEETNGQLVWEGFGDFQPSDVHKQYGICFRTPRYKNIEVMRSAG